MAQVEITKDAVESAREFILQYLRDSGYEGSLEDGTGVYDVLVKAFSLLYAMFKQQVDKTSGYLSIAKAQEVKGILGDEYDNAVDAVLANWFVSRKDGKTTKGMVRIWFLEPIDFLHLKPGEVTFRSGSEEFTVAREYVFSENDFTLVINKPDNTEEFYVDVELESLEKRTVVVTQETPMRSTLNNVYYLRTTVVSDFTQGVDKESSEEFIARTEKAITTRELITDRAINTVLAEEFDEVSFVYIAGHGAYEQMRDVKTFQDIQVHVGNKADIYLDSDLVQGTVAATVADGSVIDLSAILGPQGHVAHILEVTKDDTPVEFTIHDGGLETYWGTMGNTVVLSVPSLVSGDSVQVKYLHSLAVPKVEEYIRSEKNRVACYDPIIKNMYPVILQFNVGVRLAPLSLDTYSDIIKKAIAAYTNTIKYKETFLESVFIDYLHMNVPHIKKVAVPVNPTYQLFNPKNMTYFEGSCGDEFVIPDSMLKSKQLTQNTTQFYTSPDLITLYTI